MRGRKIDLENEWIFEGNIADFEQLLHKKFTRHRVTICASNDK